MWWGFLVLCLAPAKILVELVQELLVATARNFAVLVYQSDVGMKRKLE